jgi:hypothetical protein
MHRSQRNIYHCFRMLRKSYIHSFKKFSLIEGEMLKEGTLHNQYISLLYAPVATQLIPIMPHATKVIYLQF